MLGVTSIPRRSSSLVGTPPCSCCWSCPLTRRTDQRYRTVRRRRRSTVQPHTATATRTGRWHLRRRSTRSGCCCTATHRRGSTSLGMHIGTVSSRPCRSGSSSLATTAGRKGACHQRSYFDRMTARLYTTDHTGCYCRRTSDTRVGAVGRTKVRRVVRASDTRVPQTTEAERPRRTLRRTQSISGQQGVFGQRVPAVRHRHLLRSSSGAVPVLR